MGNSAGGGPKLGRQASHLGKDHSSDSHTAEYKKQLESMKNETKHILVSTTPWQIEIVENPQIRLKYKELGFVSHYMDRKFTIATDSNNSANADSAITDTMRHLEKEITLHLKYQCLKQHNGDLLYGLKTFVLPYGSNGNSGIPSGFIVSGIATSLAEKNNKSQKIGSNYSNATNSINKDNDNKENNDNNYSNVKVSTLPVPFSYLDKKFNVQNTKISNVEHLGRVSVTLHKNISNIIKDSNNNNNNNNNKDIDTILKDLETQLLNELKQKCVKLGGNAMYDVNVTFAPYGNNNNNNNNNSKNGSNNLDGIIVSAESRVFNVTQILNKNIVRPHINYGSGNVKTTIVKPIASNNNNNNNSNNNNNKGVAKPNGAANAKGNGKLNVGGGNNDDDATKPRSLSAWLRDAQGTTTTTTTTNTANTKKK